MIISLIAALDRQGGIGKNNQLPWRLSEDLRRFRELTTGHHIIVGRKTYESIGKHLPNRTMIVVTRQPDFKAKGCLVVNSIEAALLLAKVRDENEVFIIGGAEIYAQVLPLADRLYLTLVEAEVEADTFFPAYEEGVWVEQEVITLTADEKNQFAFTFKTLKRNENC